MAKSNGIAGGVLPSFGNCSSTFEGYVMFVLTAVVLFSVWFVGSRIYGVGGASLHFLLLLALISIGAHVVSGRRSRLAWRRS